MKVLVKEPQIVTAQEGLKPGIYVDKDEDIWFVDSNGKLCGVIEDGIFDEVMHQPDFSFAKYQIRRLTGEIILSND